jgi:hypothetical protein
VQLGLGGGVRVLHRDAGAELDVFADGCSEVGIGWQAGVVHRRDVEFDEPLPLRLSDLEPAVHGDQVREAELAGERVLTAEGLGG